jgi:membrane protein
MGRQLGSVGDDRPDASGSTDEVAMFWTLQPAIVGLFNGAVGFAVSLALSTVLWLWTPWLFVARRIPWRRLLPQALLTAVGLAALAARGSA